MCYSCVIHVLLVCYPCVIVVLSMCYVCVIGVLSTYMTLAMLVSKPSVNAVKTLLMSQTKIHCRRKGQAEGTFKGQGQHKEGTTQRRTEKKNE